MQKFTFIKSVQKQNAEVDDRMEKGPSSVILIY